MYKQQNKICAVYGGGAVIENNFRKWLAGFMSGAFSSEDWERSGIFTVVDYDQIGTLVKLIQIKKNTGHRRVNTHI